MHCSRTAYHLRSTIKFSNDIFVTGLRLNVNTPTIILRGMTMNGQNTEYIYQGLSSPHSLGPDSLVEARVDADIRCSHLLNCKLTDLLDGTGGPLLKRAGKTDSQTQNTRLPSSPQTHWKHMEKQSAPQFYICNTTAQYT
jgi:hypothetical protein